MGAPLKQDGALQSGRIRESELRAQCSGFLASLREALASGASDVDGPEFAGVRDLLAEHVASRAMQGFSPRETAIFVFSLKQPLFDALAAARQRRRRRSAARPARRSARLLDQLGLFTMEVFQKTREELIVRQQQEIAELSTPVVKLWDGILALPLIGTLDSQRTQVVMENLLRVDRRSRAPRSPSSTSPACPRSTR